MLDGRRMSPYVEINSDGGPGHIPVIDFMWHFYPLNLMNQGEIVFKVAINSNYGNLSNLSDNFKIMLRIES
jgi:hypothetical protein